MVTPAGEGWLRDFWHVLLCVVLCRGKRASLSQIPCKMTSYGNAEIMWVVYTHVLNGGKNSCDHGLLTQARLAITCSGLGFNDGVKN